MIWPGCNPGGLWRVLVDADGLEVDAGPLTLDGVDAEGIRDAEYCERAGGRALVYDGDSGELVAVLEVAP